MAVAVVDRLEAIEIEIDQRRSRAVAADIAERAIELALKTTPVEDIEQRIDVGARLQLGDLALGAQQARA